MSWAVVVQDSAAQDIERLSEADRGALWDAFFEWTEAGPPRRRRRLLGGAELFQDDLASGHTVTYFVHETEHYVAILRVRPTG
ncbi:MAG TPA: hypothetical protein VM121_03400 [Acidimicrobiales bacterium]|nr:hypothetical protein [Acidimicrobiales bacterium]